MLLASYFFYGWWDWRFLFLILFSTILDYAIGLLLNENESDHRRKFLVFISLATNLGFLGVFKYYNFFVTEFVGLLAKVGVDASPITLNVILPVGISFYTFQTLSYSIDVFRKKIKAERNFIVFAAYVSYFPQLVAGPIERASNLLPQFNSQRSFSYDDASAGMRQILLGFFKKVVVADN